MAELDPEQLRKLAKEVAADAWVHYAHPSTAPNVIAAAILTLLDRLEGDRAENQKLMAWINASEQAAGNIQRALTVARKDNAALKDENAELQKQSVDAVAPTVGPAAARPELDALLKFAGQCLDPWPDCLCDLEGEMQERLHTAGLIEERIATEDGDDYEIGDAVYFITELGFAAVRMAVASEFRGVATQAPERDASNPNAVSGGAAALGDAHPASNPK